MLHRQTGVPTRSFVLFSIFTIYFVMTLYGCGVGYTIVKSEAKLDKLSVPMTKGQVVDEIGQPDRVLRDDGRMLVWEYSLTARKQWLYELGLCPISIWIGGCIIYPFTNVAMEHQREYPNHAVSVNKKPFAWGALAEIFHRRRRCEAVAFPQPARPAVPGRLDPL